MSHSKGKSYKKSSYPRRFRSSKGTTAALPYSILLLKNQKSFRFELPRKYDSRFKTKAEEVQYRRAQILELKAQGHNQEEIAKIMNVTPTLISYDVKFMRKEAMETIKEYTTKELPLQFKATLIATQKAMKQYWDISQSTKDNKEKMLALENYLQCHMKLCRSLWEGGEKLSQFLVDYGSIKNEQQEQQQQHQYKHGDVVFTEGESPYIYHSPGNGNSNGNGNVQGEGQGLA